MILFLAESINLCSYAEYALSDCAQLRQRVAGISRNTGEDDEHWASFSFLSGTVIREAFRYQLKNDLLSYWSAVVRSGPAVYFEGCAR